MKPFPIAMNKDNLSEIFPRFFKKCVFRGIYLKFEAFHKNSKRTDVFHGFGDARKSFTTNGVQLRIRNREKRTAHWDFFYSSEIKDPRVIVICSQLFRCKLRNVSPYFFSNSFIIVLKISGMKVTRKNPAHIPPVTLFFIVVSIVSREFVAAPKPPRLLERIAWSRVQPWIHGNFVDEWNGNYFWKLWKSTKSRGKRSLIRRILVFWSRGNLASFSKDRPTQFYIADIVERSKCATLENQPHAFTDMYFLLLYFYFILLCFIFALFRFNRAIYFPLER